MTPILRYTSLLILFMFCLNGYCFSQLRYGGVETDWQSFRPLDIPKDVIDKLKNSTTVFFYRKDDEGSLQELKEAVSSGWDFTKIIFDVFDNFEKYDSGFNFSYLVLECYEDPLISSAHFSSNNFHPSIYFSGYPSKNYYLALHLNTISDALCRIELFPYMKTYKTAVNMDHTSTTMYFLYNKAQFYNWDPILLQAHLEQVSNDLRNGIRPGIEDTVRTENLANLLSNDTLYIPEKLMIHFVIGFKSKSKDVLKNFPYKYRLCSDSEIYDIFKNKHTGRFIFDYTWKLSKKIISIFDMKERKIIYRDFIRSGKKIDENDILKIK